MDPLVFEPYLRPQIWGRRQLETRLDKKLATGDFGEAWEISAHPHAVSRIAEGPLKGTLLTDLWQRSANELFGPERQPPEQFPLLIKYLDCHDLLSVQVHPTDEIASQLLGDEQGKTEAWVVISAEPTARIYAGLRPGVGPDDLQRHLAAGTVDECLHSFVPKPGDCLFLRAGTVHAVGGGVLMAEVQQTSDATFRLFDWNRVGADNKPRELHIDQSIQSIDWTAGPTNPVVPKLLDNMPPQLTGEQLVRSRYFELDRFRSREPFANPYDGEFSIWLVLDGAAELVGLNGYRRKFRRGETVLVPASAKTLRWAPAESSTVTLLGVRVP